jgi:hypothetical protein
MCVAAKSGRFDHLVCESEKRQAAQFPINEAVHLVAWQLKLVGQAGSPLPS